MSDYLGAPTSTPVAVGNGQHAELSSSQVASKFSGFTIKTPTKNFTFNVGANHVQAYKNIPLVCDAAMLAQLTAISAPVV